MDLRLLAWTMRERHGIILKKVMTLVCLKMKKREEKPYCRLVGRREENSL